jgi:hypothetical protein
MFLLLLLLLLLLQIRTAAPQTVTKTTADQLTLRLAPVRI